MGDSNPLGLGGLADNVTALTRVLRSLYHHFTITLQSLKQASVSPVITNDSVPQRSATPTHDPSFSARAVPECGGNILPASPGKTRASGANDTARSTG